MGRTVYKGLQQLHHECLNPFFSKCMRFSYGQAFKVNCASYKVIHKLGGGGVNVAKAVSVKELAKKYISAQT